jgi:hypothetical protein
MRVRATLVSLRGGLLLWLLEKGKKTSLRVFVHGEKSICTTVRQFIISLFLSFVRSLALSFLCLALATLEKLLLIRNFSIVEFGRQTILACGAASLTENHRILKRFDNSG